MILIAGIALAISLWRIHVLSLRVRDLASRDRKSVLSELKLRMNLVTFGTLCAGLLFIICAILTLSSYQDPHGLYKVVEGILLFCALLAFWSELRASLLGMREEIYVHEKKVSGHGEP